MIDTLKIEVQTFDVKRTTTISVDFNKEHLIITLPNGASYLAIPDPDDGPLRFEYLHDDAPSGWSD